MTKGSAFDAMAGRAREGMREMAQALAAEADKSDIALSSAEAATAVATGAVCQAVELFFGMCVAGGLTYAEARRELDDQIEVYWRQAVARNITKAARARIDAAALPPPIKRGRWGQ